MEKDEYEYMPSMSKVTYEALRAFEEEVRGPARLSLGELEERGWLPRDDSSPVKSTWIALVDGVHQALGWVRLALSEHQAGATASGETCDAWNATAMEKAKSPSQLAEELLSYCESAGPAAFARECTAVSGSGVPAPACVLMDNIITSYVTWSSQHLDLVKGELGPLAGQASVRAVAETSMGCRDRTHDAQWQEIDQILMGDDNSRRQLLGNGLDKLEPLCTTVERVFDEIGAALKALFLGLGTDFLWSDEWEKTVSSKGNLRRHVDQWRKRSQSDAAGVISSIRGMFDRYEAWAVRVLEQVGRGVVSAYGADRQPYTGPALDRVEVGLKQLAGAIDAFLDELAIILTCMGRRPASRQPLQRQAKRICEEFHPSSRARALPRHVKDH